MGLTLANAQSPKVTMIEWTDATFRSKHCGMITIQYMLERNLEPDSEGYYRYYFRTRSRTMYKGSQSKVWVGFEYWVMRDGNYVMNTFGDPYKISYGSTLEWDKRHTWDFRVQGADIDIDITKMYGWIGTYLNEVEQGVEMSECDLLACYRDKDLVEAYDNALKKYRINQRAMKDVREWRQEYMEEMDWATSDGVVLVKAIETLCNSFNNLIGFSSPKGRVEKLIEQYDKIKDTDRRVKFLQGIEKGQRNMNMLIAEDVAMELFKGALTELNRIGKIYAFFDDLKSDIQDFSDHSELKRQVAAQLNDFDAAIADYEKLIKVDFNALEQVIKYRQYIDGYLDDNCH